MESHLRNYLVYVTSNEQSYYQDLVNISRMLYLPSGVSEIEFYIVVSQSVYTPEMDSRFKRFAQILLKNCKGLTLKEVFFKSNRGRDFSSVNHFLNMMSFDDQDDNTVMVRNRSALGPFKKDWYKSYLDLLQSDKQMGLVGSTINFEGFYDSEYDFPPTHVQTFLYMGKLGLFKKLKTNFPGVDAETHEDAVNSGEIALSRRVVQLGYSIACLNWPDSVFNLSMSNDLDLPQTNQLKAASHLPFVHRGAFSASFDSWRLWLWKIRFALFRLLNV